MNHGLIDFNERFPQLSDAELILLAQTIGPIGESAFITLCYRCRHVVQYTIRRALQGGNPAGCSEDELELEAWATIWERLPKYDGGRKARFATYVRAFVLDAVLSEAGVRNLAAPTSDLADLVGNAYEASLPVGSPHRPQSDIETWAETADLKVDVQTFLASVSPADRQLLQKIYWTDDTKAAAARQLGVSKPAVAKRLARLHGLARTALAAYATA